MDCSVDNNQVEKKGRETMPRRTIPPKRAPPSRHYQANPSTSGRMGGLLDLRKRIIICMIQSLFGGVGRRKRLIATKETTMKKVLLAIALKV